ncbi:MAG: DUF2959 domain-containing protein [Gammaproteobacteria bacterium]
MFLQKRSLPIFLLTFLVMLLSGCQTTYYNAMEKIGYEKRDLLLGQISDARKAQEKAKEQFADALEQFISVTNFDGGELEAQYRKLKGEYEDSESRANDVRDEIKDVERVARDLFKEWEKELDQYSTPDLRRSSEQQLQTTRTRYSQLIKSMKQAEQKIDPVLEAFQDRVLFLKHNLNAQAIASLRSNRADIESDISTLIAEMNKSIAEADKFIASMETK